MSPINSATTFGPQRDTYDCFYRLAETQPDRRALITQDKTLITFGELGLRVNRLSHALRSLGLSTGDVVAAVVHNGPEYFELVLATGQVGMYLVPLNWRLDPAEIVYIIEDSGAKVLVADAAQACALADSPLPPHRFVVNGEADGWRPYADLGAAPDTAPENRMAGSVMGYTSGTTGRPKGVKRALAPVTPEELVRTTFLALLAGYGATPRTGVHLVCSPLYHAAPSGHAFAFLHAGHTLVIHSKFDAEATLRDIERHQATSSHMVPTHFHRMLRLPDEIRRRHDLSSLRLLLHAGAPCPVTVKQQMLDWLGPIIWEYLGCTEGLVSLSSPQDWLAKPGSVGRPLRGMTVKILDAAGAEVPRGEAGTIYFGVHGHGPTYEYHNDPVKTAESRVGDLATVGDLGHLDDDGYLFLLDRRSDLIISGGVNIYPAEVEQHLITHPAVADVAVIGVPDPEWGQSVLAVVQPVPEATPGEDLAEELRAHCGQGLASFKRPRRIEFLSEFPRTETGKLQRRVLRDAYQEGR